MTKTMHSFYLLSVLALAFFVNTVLAHPGTEVGELTAKAVTEFHVNNYLNTSLTARSIGSSCHVPGG